MLKSWVAAGQDPAAFWHTNLRVFAVIMSGVAERRRLEHDQMISAHWLTAALVKKALYAPKQFPSLDKLKSGGRVVERQSPKDIRNAAKVLCMMFGGSVDE